MRNERLIGIIDKVLTRSENGDYPVLLDVMPMIRELEKSDSTRLVELDESEKTIYDPENYQTAHGFSKRARMAAGNAMRNGGGYMMANVVKDTLLFDARDDFDCYCRYLEWNRPKDKKFYEPRRNTLRPLVQDLQDLYDGKLDFLGVSLPPRVGKSTLCILFITFLIGNRPDVASVMSGHSDKLTNGFYREVLSILTDNVTYLWHDIFPDVSVAETSAKNETVDLNKSKRFPTFTARSVGGTLTGAVEIGTGGVLYVDDLVEDLEESLSQERLQNKYDAYLNQLKDRKKDGAIELMVGTRWNVFDPLGRIQQQYQDNPRYRFRVIPAVDENGESNFDYPYKLGFSTEYYRDMQESIDDATWCAKYMGDPYIREGLLYPKDSLRRYYELPREEPDAIWAVCDPAQGGGDDTFLPVFYQYGNDHYLVDCVCSSSLPEVTDTMSADILFKHKVRQCQYEINAAGGRTADKVQEMTKAMGGITRITKKHTQANKETKILANSPWVKEHILFLDDKMVQPGSQYAKMLNMLTMYAITGKNKHDDVPDGLAQYALFVIDSIGNVATVMSRRF